MLRKIALAVSALAVVTSVAVQAADEPFEPTTPKTTTTKAEPATVEAAPKPAGAVKGKVKFSGEAPAPKKVDMASDPFCEGAHEGGFSRSRVTGTDGGLLDVFVELTGVPDERYKVEEPVVLDQVGCTYKPHVFGVVKKQPIKIINSDDTLHNIHAVPRSNKEFNVGMPNKGMEIEKEFKKAEPAIHIKCDVHPWMAAICFSMEHPYFAVTAADGTFSIDTTDLPDGDYGVKIWHEVLGEAEGKVTVKDGAGTVELELKS